MEKAGWLLLACTANLSDGVEKQEITPFFPPADGDSVQQIMAEQSVAQGGPQGAGVLPNFCQLLISLGWQQLGEGRLGLII